MIWDVMYGTGGWIALLLLLFMGLTILGISDSARVAIGIFVVHIFSLTLLAVVGGLQHAAVV